MVKNLLLSWEIFILIQVVRAVPTTFHPGYTYINGVLYELLDNCDEQDPKSCGAGRCCTKQELSFAPEYQELKPRYRVQCQALGSQGAFCMTSSSNEMCPCSTGLVCRPSLGPFGQCH